MADSFYQYQNHFRFIPFGGVDNVTKNMYVYEFGNDILLFDCGIGFPDEPSSNNEELLLPDFSYLLANKEKIRGLVVTHAHFDHYGAIPYLLQKLNINLPIFATHLTAEFIKAKAEEFHISSKNLNFRKISPNDKGIKISSFKLSPFHINHSVPESLGFYIEIPHLSLCHIPDFKFDWTPIDEPPFDLQKLSALCSLKKPFLLVSDCLGAGKSGHTESESSIQEVLENIIIRTRGLVIITTVSSNISRIKQAIQASANSGRYTAFLGRSLEQSCQIARKLGYFSQLKKYILPFKKIKNYPWHKLTLIVAGSYGQSDSALVRISKNKHPLLKIKKNDVVIFSADPAPPGVIVDVNKLIDNLSRLGAQVYYYEIQDNLHVSGHATAEDIKMLIALTQANYLVPIGGDFRHMRAYQLLAQKMGYKEEQILLLKEKQVLEINPQKKIIVK